MLVLVMFAACTEQREIDLAGEWQVTLHEKAKGDSLLKPNRGLGPTQNVMYQVTKLDSTAKRSGTIALPATLDEAGYGNRVVEPFLGCLSRKYQFIGEAVYSRTIRTKQRASWRIVLERVLWKSVLRIDGCVVDSCESLGTPHIYCVENLPKGKHTIEITVDNSMIHRIGEKGHAYGEHMQTIWNGILGDMRMQRIDVPQIEQVAISAPYECNKVGVRFRCATPMAQVRMTLCDKKSGKQVFEALLPVTTNARGEQEVEAQLSASEVKPWSEHSPQLYELSLYLDEDELMRKTIGFRSFKREGNQMYVNGEPLFLRGNLDNCHFPLTGYPSMKKEDWLRIFAVQKEYGCNNIRFHSYCPPEAAFEAADELGLYLAPEVGVWIDGWMPGHIVPLGKSNVTLNGFIKDELQRICEAYGTHASFAMLGIGNELGNSNFDSLQIWVDNIKQRMDYNNGDGWQQRLYTLSTARTLTTTDDFFVTHHYPKVGGVRQWMFPHTQWSYEALYAQTTVPTVAHEIGQWPVYPLWDEINKYTGVLEARNLMAIKQDAEQKGVSQYNKIYHWTSGMQSRLMYKDEIESFMRTPSCRGIHLLGMQDYSGQGEALIGFLDSFYEPKGMWKADEVRGCFSSMVTLAEFKKYGWSSNEVFEAALLARNMQHDVDSTQIMYAFYNSAGALIEEGRTVYQSTAAGEVTRYGNVALALNGRGDDKIMLRTYMVDKHGERISDYNQWYFWVFNHEAEEQKLPHDVCITSDVEEALAALNLGKRVVLDASSLGAEGKWRKGDWGAVYWSTTWFPGQAMQTLGVWLDKSHAVFSRFTCEGYADWIWWHVFEGGRVFDISTLPTDYTPMAMAVPDFHNNEKLSGLFEVALRRGKLLVSGYKLTGNSVEQRVYRNSLLEYVASDNFNPTTQVTANWLLSSFGNVVAESNDVPAEYSDALLYVECATAAEAGATPWSKDGDKCVCAESVDYNCTGVTMYKKKGNASWQFDANNVVEITTPAGELGALHLIFTEPGAVGTIEGRNFKLDDATSIVLPIDREDCLDGKLVLKIVIDASAPQVGLKQMVFTPVNKN